MAFSRLTQFLFHVIAPVLGDDSDVLHMHQATSNRPSDTWLAPVELQPPVQVGSEPGEAGESGEAGEPGGSRSSRGEGEA
ncbi:hypothetical protein R3P38DRAFT_981145 [Favolaschia claudopus]|uniref:Uncharacterized protein n=1 Tax=Favolaschia claudopus TaxID=2862362 RepID=A0AAW0BM71_9AGAR